MVPGSIELDAERSVVSCIREEKSKVASLCESGFGETVVISGLFRTFFLPATSPTEEESEPIDGETIVVK